MSKRPKVDNFHSTRDHKGQIGGRKFVGNDCWSECIYIHLSIRHNIITTQFPHSLILLGSKWELVTARPPLSHIAIRSMLYGFTILLLQHRIYEALHPYDTPTRHIKLTHYFSLLVSLVLWDIKLVTNSYMVSISNIFFSI